MNLTFDFDDTNPGGAVLKASPALGETPAPPGERR